MPITHARKIYNFKTLPIEGVDGMALNDLGKTPYGQTKKVYYKPQLEVLAAQLKAVAPRARTNAKRLALLNQSAMVEARTRSVDGLGKCEDWYENSKMEHFGS